MSCFHSAERRPSCIRAAMHRPSVRAALSFSFWFLALSAVGISALLEALLALPFLPSLSAGVYRTVCAVLSAVLCCFILSPLYEGMHACALSALDEEEGVALSTVFCFYSSFKLYAYAVLRGLGRCLRGVCFVGGVVLAARLGTVISRMTFRDGDVLRSVLVWVITVLFLVFYSLFFVRVGLDLGPSAALYQKRGIPLWAVRRASYRAMLPYRRRWLFMHVKLSLLMLLCLMTAGLFSYYIIPYCYFTRAAEVRRILLD